MFLGFLSDLCYSKRSPVSILASLISFLIFGALSLSYKGLGEAWWVVVMSSMGLLLGGINHLVSATASADIGAK